MTKEELEADFKNRIDNLEKTQWPAAMIEYQGEKGIALMLGENLATGTWLSGDIIVHREKGEHTVLPDEFTLVNSNIWK
ncbi:hypothetical protein P4H94_04450 [Paenibacillus macerans]|uniref:hypothetical protein n=1 Tax=Paenibacillus macerans TaxID=44252 RepID=UPI002DBAEA77|nr:hypothetical protein [Paenibacillus macerans]MEC0136138.1 hypothetical protein [Paenibacillus macerans]